MENNPDPFAQALVKKQKELGKWLPAFTIEGLCTGICNGVAADLGFKMEIYDGQVISFIARASMLPEMFLLAKETV